METQSSVVRVWPTSWARSTRAKRPNVVVAHRDPLDVKTDVKRVFIDGREVAMTSRQTELRNPHSGH
jgi:hypothetical protein